LGNPKRYKYGYDLRKVASARVHVGRRVDGRLEARIAHAPLRGVTSKMLVWWFENFADSTGFVGSTRRSTEMNR